MTRAIASLFLVALLLVAACGSSGPDTRTQITRPVGGEGFIVSLDHAAEGTNPIDIPLADEPLEPVFVERVLPVHVSSESTTTTSEPDSGGATTSASRPTSRSRRRKAPRCRCGASTAGSSSRRWRRRT